MFHSHSHTYAHNYTQSAMPHWTYHSHTIGRTILSAQTLTHSLSYAHTSTAPSAWCIFGLRLEKLWDCHLCTRTHAHCTFDIEHWRWCLCNSSSGGGGVCVRECANVFLPTYFPFVCFFPFGKKHLENIWVYGKAYESDWWNVNEMKQPALCHYIIAGMMERDRWPE